MNDPINKIDPSGLSDLNLHNVANEPDFFYADQLVLQSPGTFSVGGHGGESVVLDQNKQHMSAHEMATLIKNTPGYLDGTPVKLNACDTGAGGPGADNFAQNLSNILGVEVIAPTGDMMLYTDGRLSFVDQGTDWQQFTPSKVPLK